MLRHGPKAHRSQTMECPTCLQAVHVRVLGKHPNKRIAVQDEAGLNGGSQFTLDVLECQTGGRTCRFSKFLNVFNVSTGLKDEVQFTLLPQTFFAAHIFCTHLQHTGLVNWDAALEENLYS